MEITGLFLRRICTLCRTVLLKKVHSVSPIKTKIGKNYYFFSKTTKTLGQMQKNSWQTISNKKYYFKANGVMATGKTKVGKNYYFFSKKTKTLGQMQKNCWQTISKKKYYFKSNGVMAKSCTMKIKGKKYKFNAKGQLVK